MRVVDLTVLNCCSKLVISHGEVFSVCCHTDIMEDMMGPKGKLFLYGLQSHDTIITG